MTSLYLSIVCRRVGATSFGASFAFVVGSQRRNMPPKAKALSCAGGVDKTKRVRCQAGRRETDPAKIDRFLKEFIITKLPVITIETKRVDGDLIDAFQKNSARVKAVLLVRKSPMRSSNSTAVNLIYSKALICLWTASSMRVLLRSSKPRRTRTITRATAAASLTTSTTLKNISQ